MTNYFLSWQENLSEEISFWKQYLDNHTAHQERIEMVDKFFPFSYLINSSSPSTLKVLDVGSGPLTTIGTLMPDFVIELTSCDPLADKYNDMLRKVGLSERANIKKVAGEDLTQVFKKNTFDFVHSANALDHSYNPLSCIQNMLEVCKPQGYVIIITVENEGERENYQGLHQWNFSLEQDELILYTKNKEDNFIINNELKQVKQFKAYRQ
jgi:SAM-dependent methyltransferase